MTPEEKEEYTALKYARAEQGYFTAEQLERWNYLHKLQGEEFLRLLKVVEEQRQMKLN